MNSPDIMYFGWKQGKNDMKIKIGILFVLILTFVGAIYYKTNYIGSIEEAIKRSGTLYDEIYKITERKGRDIVIYGKDDILSAGLIKRTIFGYRWIYGFGGKQFNEKERALTNAFSNLPTETRGNNGEVISLAFGVVNDTNINKLKIKYKDQDVKEATMIETSKGVIWFCFSDSPVNYDPNIIGLSKSGETIFQLPLENGQLQSQAGQQNDIIYEENKVSPVFFTTAVIKETAGKQGPGDNYKDIAKLSYGRLVSISGRYMGNVTEGEWLLATMTPEMSENGALIVRPENMKKFWIRYDLIEPLTERTISFDDLFPVTEVAEYDYVVIGDPSKDGKAFMRQMPDEKSPYAALMQDGNLISVVRRDKGWSLVKKFNGSTMEEITRVGWIKNDSYRKYNPSMKVTQGFVLRSVKMYENPDTNSKQYPTENLKSAVLPVNILKSQNGWTYISSGFNGLVLWVKSDEVRYFFTSDELFKLAYPNVDKSKFIGAIKTNIRNRENIELRVEDVGEKVILSSGQKSTLAEN